MLSKYFKMSCRPAVVPPSKSYLVRRLDGVEQEVTLFKKATGGECLDKVKAHSLMLERSVHVEN